MQAVCWLRARPECLKISGNPPDFPTRKHFPYAHGTDEESEAKRRLAQRALGLPSVETGGLCCSPSPGSPVLSWGRDEGEGQQSSQQGLFFFHFLI